MASGVQPTHFKNIEQILQSPLALSCYSRRNFDPDAFAEFLATAQSTCKLGLAGEYENKTSQKLVSIAFASETRAFVIEFGDDTVSSDNGGCSKMFVSRVLRFCLSLALLVDFASAIKMRTRKMRNSINCLMKSHSKSVGRRCAPFSSRISGHCWLSI
jgi:hypothetical protein